MASANIVKLVKSFIMTKSVKTIHAKLFAVPSDTLEHANILKHTNGVNSVIFVCLHIELKL